MPNKRHCTYCDSEEHTVFYCIYKPKNAINPRGKYRLRMDQVRREWYALNQPDHAGYYYCALCGKALKRNEVELDHILSRSRHPELRFDLSNLQPTCHDCNTKKGSKEVTAFFK